MRTNPIAGLSYRFQRERERASLSRAQLATAAGMSAEQVRRVEAGISQPGANLLSALCTSGADISYVLTGMCSKPVHMDKPHVHMDSFETRLAAIETRLSTAAREVVVLLLAAISHGLEARTTSTDRSNDHA